MEYGRTYTAQTTVTGASGLTTTRTARFTTMARPARQVDSVLYFQDGRTYGAHMPVAVSFEPGVPKEARAGVQRRLLVLRARLRFHGFWTVRLGSARGARRPRPLFLLQLALLLTTPRLRWPRVRRRTRRIVRLRWTRLDGLRCCSFLGDCRGIAAALGPLRRVALRPVTVALAAACGAVGETTSCFCDTVRAEQCEPRLAWLAQQRPQI